MNNILDIRYKILEKTIKEEIQHFEHLNPEELVLLLEEYCAKLRNYIEEINLSQEC